jgi:hypothetical protein
MLTTDENVKQYAIIGGTPAATYAIPFPYWGAGEISAILTLSDGTDETLTITTDYTLSAPGATGTLTRVGTWTATAIRLTIVRELDVTQETDYRNGDVLDAENLEESLDRLTAIAQQLKEVTDRQVSVPVTDTSTVLILPGAEERATKILGFNADGDAIAADGGATAVSVFMAPVVSAADSNAAQIAMGLDAVNVSFDDSTTDIDETDVQGGLDKLGTEYLNVLTGAGLTFTPAQTDQLLQAIEAISIKNSHAILENLGMEIDKATSATFPALKRNINQDIDIANWPLLVPEARAASITILGVNAHPSNVSGSVITLDNTTAAIALLNLIINDGVVTNYLHNGEIANFLGGAVYNVAAAQRCVTIADVEYPITAVDAIARTITVTGTPASGAQNLYVYPYRIAGSATTARFLRIAGFVGVAAGDAGGEVVGGFRKMDRGQGNWRNLWSSATGEVSSLARSATAVGGTVPLVAGTTDAGISIEVRGARSDTVNGTPRVGKTTDPRTAGQYAYTWGGQYIAP